MPTIRVDPSILNSSAASVNNSAEGIKSAGNNANSASSSAPSYDGQFGPKVKAIGNEALSIARGNSEKLTNHGNKLFEKASAFQNADTISIDHKQISPLLPYLPPDWRSGPKWDLLSKLGLLKDVPYDWVKDPDHRFLRNMQDLAKKSDDLYKKHHAAEIYKINGEYVVLISGTVGGTWLGWQSAADTFEGKNTRLKDEVTKLILDPKNEIPKDAIIHLVGHSQGGMGAEQLSENNELNSNYKIRSVIAFNSVTDHIADHTGTEYYRYSSKFDLVSNIVVSSEDGWQKKLSDSAISIWNTSVGATPPNQTQLIQYDLNPFYAHSSYKDSLQLAQIDSPIKGEWGEPIAYIEYYKPQPWWEVKHVY